MERDRNTASSYMNIAMVLLLIILVMLSIRIGTKLVTPLTANAKEESYTVSFSNYFETETEDGTDSWSGTTSFSCTVPQGYTFYGFRRNSDSYGVFTPCLVEDETDTIIYSATTTFGNLLSNVTASRHLTTESGGCIDDTSKTIDTSYVFRSETEYTYKMRYINVAASCSFPIFDSEEALKTYLATGDDSGQVNKPKPTDFDDAPYIGGAFWLNDFNAEISDDILNVSWDGYTVFATGEVLHDTAYVLTSAKFMSINTGETVTKQLEVFDLSDNGFSYAVYDLAPGEDYFLYEIRCRAYTFDADNPGSYIAGAPNSKLFNRYGDRITSEDDPMEEGAVYDPYCKFVDFKVSAIYGSGALSFPYNSYFLSNCTYTTQWSDVTATDAVSSYVQITLTSYTLKKERLGDYIYSTGKIKFSDMGFVLTLKELTDFLADYNGDKLTEAIDIKITPYYYADDGFFYGDSMYIYLDSTDGMGNGSISTGDGTGEPDPVTPDTNWGNLPDDVVEDLEEAGIWEYLKELNLGDLFNNFLTYFTKIGVSVLRVCKVVSSFFGFMPWWITDSLGAIFLMCVIARLLGR